MNMDISISTRWKYIHISSIEVIRLSGWKLYVYGENIVDSNLVGELLLPIGRDYNVTIKMATKAIIDRNIKIKPAWGIGVIYLHSELFELKLIKLLLKDINNQLISNSYNKYGHYPGSKHIINSLSYRYDLNIPINPNRGLFYEDYLERYRGEFGEYNILRNKDLVNYL